MNPPGTTGTLYQLRDVQRVYRTGAGTVAALDGVDLDIEAGEFIAVEGPSGSGKSTMLQMLGALDRPTSGSLQFDGRELRGLSDAELTRLRSRDIGFVFQAFNLIPTLTAAENVEAAMVPLNKDRAGRRARATELLDRVGLASRADHLPSRLSGGEQQRVAIARALSNEPRVILADEPTGNLDSSTAEEVVGVLRSLSTEGVTVIVVTHAEDVARHAARRVRLRDGRVASDETEVERAKLFMAPAADRDDPRQRIRELCLALPDVTERLSHGEPTWFWKGKKTFVTYADHHHDDREAFWCAAPEGTQAELVASDPKRFFVPPYVGGRGWVGMWVDVAVEWDEVGELVAEAYRVVTEKKPTPRT
jgi:putative ABC transport system ATP-binding protein